MIASAVDPTPGAAPPLGSNGGFSRTATGAGDLHRVPDAVGPLQSRTGRWFGRHDADRALPDSEERRAAPAIGLHEVEKAFGNVPVLDRISLAVSPGSRLALVGPSGCGKSTLLRMVAGLVPIDGGSIEVGRHQADRSRLALCSMMPQQDLLLPWRSALDNACLALENRGVRRRQARLRAAPLFEHFGLAGFESSLPSQLSGGMRQRVSFLRTLMSDKGVMLLDEPFGALDAITRAEMQAWLGGALDDAPRTVLLVTHDVEEALLLCDTVVVLSSRPARIVHRVDVGIDKRGERVDTISKPEFVSLKHEILGALSS